jgi:CheY-specific phosphatase CheX
VKLGVLKAPEVEQVLRSQRNSHVMIGEALVATGALDRKRLDQQLAAFHEDQKSYRVAAGIPKELDPSGIGSPALDLCVKLLERLCGLRVRRVMARPGAASPAIGASTAARVPFSGELSGYIGLRTQPRTAAALAGALLREDVAETDAALLTDALSEILNMVAGNVSAQLAQKGRSLELGAPLAGALPPPSGAEKAFTAELGAPGHEVLFVLVAG